MIRTRCPRFRTSLGLAILVMALAGCSVWQRRAEFAPPGNRWPDTQPSPVAADVPPPPIDTVHCYRTLAIVDCFLTKQPERFSGYTGSYAE
jgi:hypothetical protein